MLSCPAGGRSPGVAGAGDVPVSPHVPQAAAGSRRKGGWPRRRTVEQTEITQPRDGPMHWSRIPALFLTCALLTIYWSPSNPAGRPSAAAGLHPTNELQAGFEARPDPLPWVVPASRSSAALIDQRMPVQAISSQELTEQATLETRRPEVQWSAAGAPTWESVPA